MLGLKQEVEVGDQFVSVGEPHIGWVRMGSVTDRRTQFDRGVTRQELWAADWPQQGFRLAGYIAQTLARRNDRRQPPDALAGIERHGLELAGH